MLKSRPFKPLKNLSLGLLVLALFTLSFPPQSLAKPRYKPPYTEAPKESVSRLNSYMTRELGIEDLGQFNLTWKLKSFSPEEIAKFFSPVSATVLGDIFDSLGRSQYNNTVVLGAPGVGKSFLLKQIVGIYSYGVIPEYLKNELRVGSPQMEVLHKAFIGNMDVVLINNDILSLDPSKAGQAFGDSDSRKRTVLTNLFEAAKAEFKNSGRRTLFLMNEAHSLPSLAQEALKTILDETGFRDPSDSFEAKQDVGVSFIAMTTPNEYRKMVKADGAIERRYKPTRIIEPDVATVLTILIDDAERHRRIYNMEADLEALEYLVRMNHLLFSPPQAMPHSAKAALNDLFVWAARQKGATADGKITLADAQRYVMRRAGLTDAWLPGPNGEPPFHDLAERVKKLVVDHDQTIDQISRILKTWARLGFGGELPVILLGGPSGSGKNTLVEAFNLVLFGNKGRHLSFSIGGEGGFGMDAIISGPPLGNHSDHSAPLALQRMENDGRPAFLVFNEGKDAKSLDLAKLKDFVESGQISPMGFDNRARPLLFPIFMLGQWGEELFEGAATDKEITERAALITSKEINQAFLIPKGEEGKGVIPRALLQRIRKTGGAFIIPPVQRGKYENIVSLNVEELVLEQRRMNGLNIEITPRLKAAVAKMIAENPQSDPRELEAAVVTFTTTAISEAADQGIPYRHARLQLDVQNDKVQVSHLDAEGRTVKSVSFNSQQLSRSKDGCGLQLGQI